MWVGAWVSSRFAKRAQPSCRAGKAGGACFAHATRTWSCWQEAAECRRHGGRHYTPHPPTHPPHNHAGTHLQAALHDMVAVQVPDQVDHPRLEGVHHQLHLQ